MAENKMNVQEAVDLITNNKLEFSDKQLAQMNEVLFDDFLSRKSDDTKDVRDIALGLAEERIAALAAQDAYDAADLDGIMALANSISAFSREADMAKEVLAKAQKQKDELAAGENATKDESREDVVKAPEFEIGEDVLNDNVNRNQAHIDRYGRFIRGAPAPQENTDEAVAGTEGFEHLQELKAGKTFTHFINNESFLKAEIKYGGTNEKGQDFTRIELFDHSGKSVGYLVQPFESGGKHVGEINGQPTEISFNKNEMNLKHGDTERSLVLENPRDVVSSADSASKGESSEIRDMLLDVAEAYSAIHNTSYLFWRNELAQTKNYSKERLDSILKAHDVYLQAPREVQNRELLEEMDSNFGSVHNDLFVETVETAEKDIAHYANGELTIDADAYDSMKKYIETFGKSTQKDENGEFMYTPEAQKALERLNAEKEKVAEREENISQTGPKMPMPAHKSSNNQENTDNRIRSPHNLSNEQKLASVRLQVLSEMKVISAEDYGKYSADIFSNDIETAQKAFEFADNAEDKIKKPDEYRNNLVDTLLKEDLTELMTPELTTLAYENLQKRMKKAQKENSEEAKQTYNELAGKLNDVLARMDNLQSDFKNKRGYYLLDITNAADAYDGYEHMFDVRSKDLERKNKELEENKKKLNSEENKEQITEIDKKISENNALKNEYSQSSQDLDEIIAVYDEKWNIPSGKNPRDTAIDFNDRIKVGSKILDGLKFDEETLGAETLTEIGKFKFNDENGKPIPQFIDPKNPEIKSDVWRKGLEVDPNGQLATVLKLAENDVLMENLGSKEKLTKDFMVSELRDNIPFKLFEMYNPEATIRGAIEDPAKFSTKKDQYLAEFREKLNNPEIPLAISPEGYRAALDDQVNKVETFANRLDKKLGKANAEFTKAVLFEQVEKIDKQAPNRGRKPRDLKTSAIKRGVWGIALGGTLAYVGSRLVTNAAATGGVSLLGSSAVALGAAVTVGAISTAVQVWSRKRQAKKRGEKYGWKEFKKDRMLHASIATTTLACASAAFAMANMPELAIGCALGSFGMGMGLRFAQPYRDMRLKGHGKIAAAVMGAANAAAVLVGGYYGRQHGMEDITPGKHEVPNGDKEVKVGESKTYSEAQITKVTERNNTNTMWEYRGEGPHDIPAYRNPDNYSNEAWWTPEQHDKAIAALKEQMPKLGWKEGVGNEEVMLRKLASFERLHRNSDFVLPDGKTVGEKFGDYKALLDGLLEGKLTPEGAKQLDVIQYNVGENGHSKILNSLGSELYSYQDHPHGIQTEAIMDKVPQTKLVDNTVEVHGGGVFGWIGSSWKKFKNKIRPGAKADRVEKAEKPMPEQIPVLPVPEPEKKIEKKPEERIEKKPEEKIEKKPEERVEKKPEPKPEIIDDKLLLDEYKIVYGIAPNTEEGKNEAWKNYCQRVEEERKTTAPEMSTNEFLLARRKKLDDLIMSSVPGDTEVNADGKPIRKDYMLKQAKDDRGRAGVVMEARQNLMQSNLTTDNIRNKITLSHFTKFIGHFIKKDEVVADGTRDISLNPKLKDKYKSGKSKVAVIDLNQYLVDGKPLEEAKQRVSGQDARRVMAEVKKNAERSH